MPERHTPISYDNLFLGMRDKGPETDEKGPFPRRLVNFDSDGNSAKPRPGLAEMFNVGKTIREIYIREHPEDDTIMYIFTTNELFKSTETAPGIWGNPSSIGTYDYGTNGFIDTAMYIEKGTMIHDDNVDSQGASYIKSSTILTPEEYTGHILRLDKGSGNYEEFSITTNTFSEIHVDGFIEENYVGTTYEIYRTRESLHFTSNGKLYNTPFGLNVADTGVEADFCGVYAGRMFICKEEDSSVLFANTQTLTFPSQQMIKFDTGDGVFLGFENYLESFIVIMERGIYSINGSVPEEFVPRKRVSEGVKVNSKYSFASKNGVMYFMSNRGFESMSRVDTRAQPQARDISFYLNRSRFASTGLDGYGKMFIFGNKILSQMNGYILVYDTDLSAIIGEHWFAEYDGFSFRAAQEYDGNAFFADGSSMYVFEEGKMDDDNGEDIECLVEGNAIEYAQRDMRKFYREVIFYQTWNKSSGASMEFTSWGRDIPESTVIRTADLTDEVVFDCNMESPYLKWRLKMKGDFTLEDIIFFLKPQRGLQAKSHII